MDINQTVAELVQHEGGICIFDKIAFPLPCNTNAVACMIKGAVSVFADGGNRIANFGSQFAERVVDEGRSMGGIVSGIHLGGTDWITHSVDVFFEGKPACRLTDKLFMNRQGRKSSSPRRGCAPALSCPAELSPAARAVGPARPPSARPFFRTPGSGALRRYASRCSARRRSLC